MRNMIQKNIAKMIIAITKMIEVKTANIVVKTEYEKIRMEDFKTHFASKSIDMDDDFSSWPDDFEEDWE